MFTFPNTGIYYVNAWFRLLRDGDSRYNNLALQVTLNNSSYSDFSFGSAFIKRISSSSENDVINHVGNFCKDMRFAADQKINR